MAKKCHIGCSSFYNYKWKNIFYPENIASKNWFDYYAQHLDAFEINSTFYKFPTLKVMQNWYDRSPKNYLFSVKAPKEITHIKKFQNCEAQLNTFYTVSENGLKEKLACFLFQFPPSFDYADERLQSIIQNLNPKYKNVVEFRHESWWNPKIIAKLKSNNIIFCSVSHPKLPEEIIENEWVYIRLHGNPKMFYSSYSQAYLENLSVQLQKTNLKMAYVFFNNTASDAGIVNALELQKLL